MKEDTSSNSQQPEGDTHPADDECTPNEAREIGGRRDGLDPTRYGDWEKNGRCIDF